MNKSYKAQIKYYEERLEQAQGQKQPQIKNEIEQLNQFHHSIASQYQQYIQKLTEENEGLKRQLNQSLDLRRSGQQLSYQQQARLPY